MTQEQEKYIEAKHDALKAAKSFNELTLQQREQLAKELLGAEVFAAMCKMMRQYFVGGTSNG